MTGDEKQRLKLAQRLSMVFTAEELAEFLHKNYRAADKAMRRDGHKGPFGRSQHDHGFRQCHRHAYFIRRAEWLLNGKGTFNGHLIRLEKLTGVRP